MANKINSFSPVGIIDNLVFSDSSVSAYYKLAGDGYDFKQNDDLIATAQGISNNLASLLPNKVTSTECHLIITSRPIDANKWETELKSTIAGWYPENKQDKFENLELMLAKMRNYMYQNNFVTQEVYLGVKLGDRGSISDKPGSFNLNEVFSYTKSVVDSFMKTKDNHISAEEEKFWKEKEKKPNNVIVRGRHLRGTEATPAQLAYLIKQPVYPLMPIPDFPDEQQVWGRGEVQSLGESWIEKHPKFLKITQQNWDGSDMSAYRATLAFAKFPDAMSFPDGEPWIHTASLLGVGVTFNSRFTIVPAEKVRKDLNRKLQETKDEAVNARNAGVLPQDIEERMSMAEALEYEINRNGGDWVYGRYRLHIEAPTEEILRTRVAGAISHYKDLGIELVWPSGADQFDLLLESFPGDKVRIKNYEQKQMLPVIGGGMPTAVTSIGDRKKDNKGWIGPFLGRTTTRFSEAVFMSIHSAISQNEPPGLVITGSPGAGKSFTAFKCTVDMALQGIWTIYIDPKADATPIGTIPGLEDSTIFDLSNGEDGILDPFALGADTPDSILMALETIRLLLGGNLSPEQDSQISVLIKKHAQDENISLNLIVDKLLESDDPHANSVGNRLDIIRDLRFARLCFAPRTTVKISPDKGLTVITLLGLDLPDPDVDPKDYSQPHRLSVAVMYLLATFTLQLMRNLDKSHPKAVVIDEAWSITSTSAGKQLIPQIARMGRSHNTALMLISQNAGDFLKEGWSNSVSMRMAFQAKTKGEVEDVIKFLDLEPSDLLRDRIKNLEKGECLFQDAFRRTSTVQIIEIDEDHIKAFDTNPHTRGKKQLEEQIA